MFLEPLCGRRRVERGRTAGSRDCSRLAGGDRIEIGLGTGPAVLRTVKKLGELLRAENHRRSVFVVRPIEPAGYSALYPGTSPLSFARYLETPWSEVVIEPWQKTTGLQLAVLDAHESEPRDLPPGTQPRNLVLLAGPGDLRTVRPWFETPGRFTHAFLHPKTAAGLVEVESNARQP